MPFKNKEAQKAYYEKNKEACKAYSKAYKEKNKEAIAAQRKSYREKNKEAIKAYLILKKYGITLAEKKEMLNEQGNKCKICLQDFPSDVAPNVDHCHTSGKVRGLLCWNCNIGLGSFKDNPVVLIKAAEYLKEQGEQDVR